MAEEKNITSINAFLAQNVAAAENEEVKFARFSAPFVIKAIGQAENDVLQKAATKRVKQNGVWTESLDSSKYVDQLVKAAVVTPDLNNAELQKSYGTMGKPVDTLHKMLLSGEYAELAKRVQTLAGFETEDLEELSEDVKN